MARRLKDKPEFVDVDAPFTPLPKYGHLSEKHPEYAKREDALRVAFTYKGPDDYPSIRKMMGNREAVIPPGGPDREKDVVTEFVDFTARDGHTVELKLYRSPRATKDATLMLRMHGGGGYINVHGPSMWELHG